MCHNASEMVYRACLVKRKSDQAKKELDGITDQAIKANPSLKDIRMAGEFKTHLPKTDMLVPATRLSHAQAVQSGMAASSSQGHSLDN